MSYTLSRFTTRRIAFHAPLGYALYVQSSQLYVSPEVEKGNFDEIEHVVTVPSTPAFASITAPLEIRIYAFGAKFDGRATSLTGVQGDSSSGVETAPGIAMMTNSP